MKKKVAIILIVTVLLFGVISLLFLHDISDKSLGAVTSISLKSKNSDKVELRLDYILPSGGYSVREVPEDEGIYVGDGMIDYDGSLGKYRIMITFGDVQPADKFTKKLSPDGSFELMEQPIKSRAAIAYPSGHGFVLYIGSDTPIHVENLENGQLNPLGGTIRIPITIDNA